MCLIALAWRCLTSECFAADVSKEQLKLYKLSRSDEEFQRVVMERDLGPEQKQLQEKIRKQIQVG